MKWTIGMPSYANLTEVWFTVENLLLYHERYMQDAEIIVIDNFGDPNLETYLRKHDQNHVRYIRANEIQGVSYAKNKIFEHARGDQVLVMDSHILVQQGALDLTIADDNLYHGALLHAGNKKYSIEWLPKWRANMWGIWGDSCTKDKLPTEPKEIWAMGAGFFACKRESWLGFNPGFRGFGGETGYIQEKYRQAGRKVFYHPKLIWKHLFFNEARKIPYPVHLKDRINNYMLGFNELGLDTNPIYEHFKLPKN